jgi:DNA end-binding protein Ku
MPKSLWTGYISFGMVNIPVALVAAVRDKSIRFHLLHAKDGARLKQKMVCPVDGREVPRKKAALGFELAPDHYVMVEPEELEAIEPKRTRTIEISDFVEMSQIDPIYYEHPYYLIPREGAGKAYGLLMQAMVEMKKTAIGKFVFHNREYVAAIRPLDQVFCLEVMRFPDEIVSTHDLEPAEYKKVKAADKQLDMAKQLIGALATDFRPQDYKDDYRDKVMGLIEKKAKGERVVTAPPVFEEGKVIDLMAALERSLRQVRNGEEEGASAEKRPARAAKKSPAKKSAAKKSTARKTTAGSKRKAS